MKNPEACKYRLISQVNISVICTATQDQAIESYLGLLAHVMVEAVPQNASTKFKDKAGWLTCIVCLTQIGSKIGQTMYLSKTKN